VENPLPDEYPLRDGGAPVPPAGAEVGAAEAEEAEAGEAE
jgi:hypothetical protein